MPRMELTWMLSGALMTPWLQDVRVMPPFPLLSFRFSERERGWVDTWDAVYYARARAFRGRK